MPSLRATFFGYPKIILDGKAIKPDRKKVMGLLVYLLSNEGGFGRDSLAAVFWPDLNEQKALAYLRNALWEIRKLIGEEWLELEGKTVRFRHERGAWVDTEYFDRSLQDKQQTSEILHEAIDIYQADFLAGFNLPDSQVFDEWQTGRSEYFRILFDHALENITNVYCQVAELDVAAAMARRRVELDPLNEQAQRTLIELLGRTGQRTAAMRQYELCQTILREELDVQPEEATFEVYRKVSDGEITSEKVVEEPQLAKPFQVGNVPSAVKPFVGRAEELARLGDYLADLSCRLITITGPGGVGKTSLALAAARANEHRFPHGIWFVSFASVTPEEGILNSIVEVLQINQVILAVNIPSDRLLNQLITYLRSKEVLLVLDNMEHLTAYSTVIQEIINQTRGVKCLVTSRERLSLPEEWVYAISGLPVPGFHTLGRLDDYEAVQLFISAARRAQADFKPKEDDWQAIARICQQVGGLPLGLELAAYWVRLLPCSEIALEMDRTLDFLYSNQAGLPERQRSLQATVDYSWSLLNERERTAFRRLAIFEGGFDHSAAAHITGISLSVLGSLLDKSLVQREGEYRYSLHPVLRQYSFVRLKDNPAEYRQIQDWYSAYYLNQMVDWFEGLKGSQQLQVLNLILRDQANILYAWKLALEYEELDLIQRSALGLTLTFAMRGTRPDAYSAFMPALKLARKNNREDLVAFFMAVLRYIATISPEEQMEFEEKSLAILQTLPCSPVKAYSQIMLAIGPTVISPDEQIILCRESESYLHSIGDEWGAGLSTLMLGDNLLFGRNRIPEAKDAYHRGHSFFNETKNDWGIGLCLAGLGYAALDEKKYPEVCKLFTDSISIFEKLGDVVRVANQRYALHFAFLEMGKVKEAIQLLTSNLPILEQFGMKDALASHRLIIEQITSQL